MLCYIAHLERGRGGKRKVEYGTLIVRAACRSGAVEIAVAALHQRCFGICGIAVGEVSVEGIQTRNRSTGTDFENGANVASVVFQ